MWIFKADGTLEQRDRFELGTLVDPETWDPKAWDPKAFAKDAPSVVTISFSSFADGRGFSIARHLRQVFGPAVTLQAQGHVLSDQARHAFQSGFDAVLISDKEMERQTQDAWSHALTHAVGSLYVGAKPATAIWSKRAVA